MSSAKPGNEPVAWAGALGAVVKKALIFVCKRMLNFYPSPHPDLSLIYAAHHWVVRYVQQRLSESVAKSNDRIVVTNNSPLTFQLWREASEPRTIECHFSFYGSRIRNLTLGNTTEMEKDLDGAIFFIERDSQNCCKVLAPEEMAGLLPQLFTGCYWKKLRNHGYQFAAIVPDMPYAQGRIRLSIEITAPLLSECFPALQPTQWWFPVLPPLELDQSLKEHGYEILTGDLMQHVGQWQNPLLQPHPTLLEQPQLPRRMMFLYREILATPLSSDRDPSFKKINVKALYEWLMVQAKAKPDRSVQKALIKGFLLLLVRIHRKPQTKAICFELLQATSTPDRQTPLVDILRTALANYFGLNATQLKKIDLSHWITQLSAHHNGLFSFVLLQGLLHELRFLEHSILEDFVDQVKPLLGLQDFFTQTFIIPLNEGEVEHLGETEEAVAPDPPDTTSYMDALLSKQLAQQATPPLPPPPPHPPASGSEYGFGVTENAFSRRR